MRWVTYVVYEQVWCENAFDLSEIQQAWFNVDIDNVEKHDTRALCRVLLTQQHKRT